MSPVKSPTTKTTRVPEILKVLHLADEHRVTEVQIRRGRIEADLDQQRPSCFFEALEFGAQFRGSHHVHAPLREVMQLFVDSHESAQL